MYNMLVQLKPEIKSILLKNKPFDLQNGGHIIYIDDMYYPSILAQYDYIDVENHPTSINHYKTTRKHDMWEWTILKDHTIPYNSMELDDKLFEWEE